MGTKFLKMSHIWLSGLALVLGLNSACSSGGSTASSDNATAPVITACGGNNGDSGLLANGNFESGSDNWTGVAANPLSDVNGNVVNYANVETAAANPWDVNLQQVVELTQGLTYKLSFSAMSNVERKIGAGIGLNEEPYTNSQQEVSLTTACQDFELELSSANFGGANSRVFFDMGAEVGEVIIDDVTLVETTSSAGPDAAPTTSAPTPTATDVISVYSDAYTDISTVNLNPGWGQSTVFSEETIDGGNVIKLGGLNYQGIEMDPNYVVSQDVSGKTTLHVDYWTADSTLFRVFLISPDADADGNNEETFHNVTLATGSWQSLEIPLSTYSGTVNLSDIIQMKFDGDGTIYLDNIYFY